MAARLSFATMGLLAMGSILGGCSHIEFGHSLAVHLSDMHAAVGDVTETTLLRYDARVDGRKWTFEIVRGPGVFAERKSHGSNVYTVGLTGDTPWMRSRERRPVVVDGALESEARTDSAIWNLTFASPRAGDKNDLIVGGSKTWEMAHLPKDGETIWLTVERDTSLPISYDVVDPYDRPTRCTDIQWRTGRGPATIERAHCSGIVSHVGTHDVDLELEEEEAIDAPPDWARADDALPLVPQTETVTIPIADPMRLIVPTSVSDAEPIPMVLDSGAPFSAITRTQARALGVVDTDSVPAHVKPPWLPTDTYAVGLIDKMTVGSGASAIELHGVRVYIMEDDAAMGQEAGLLGIDFFRHFVVDVDSPRGELNFVKREDFHPDPRAAAIPMSGVSHRTVNILGSVDRVDDGELIVDTGAALDIVVSDYRMSIVHPRERDSDAFLGSHEEETSADYLTEIDGMRFGPFHFPRMPAYGRDRERDRLGCGLGLVGMGVMRHMRLAFDVHDGLLYTMAGPSYVALTKLGIEIEDRGGKPIITRVITQSSADAQRFRMGDEVLFVGKKRVKDAITARNEIAATILKDERVQTVDISLDRNTRKFTRRVVIQR